MNYESAKKYLWPHVLVPFAVLISLEYMELLVRLLQIVVSAWIVTVGMGFITGVWVQLMVETRSEEKLSKTHWADLLNMKIALSIPSIKWGADLTKWALSTVSPKEED